ncbi:MAG: hypothetical protein RL594_61 [Bacteroidota bacterium]|jgi:hypothetical protein
MRALRHLVMVLMLLMTSVRGLAQSADTTSAFTPLAGPTKSSTTAILYSLAFPGLGQIYTENYWKVPLFTGAAVATAVLFVRNNADFATAATAYDDAVANGLDAATTNILLRRREAFRDNRDLAGVFFLITYALAAVDSYVGAELYQFDTGENLSLSAGPSARNLVAVNLRLTW